MYDKPSVVNPESVNYNRFLVDLAKTPWRDDVKPLHVVQPQVRIPPLLPLALAPAWVA
jgi:hypothetical protein